MKLTKNETSLLLEIDKEPASIDDYCFWLKWGIPFGKGVLGSLTKKGLVESESITHLGGWSFHGETSEIDKITGSEKHIILNMTSEGMDFVGTDEFMESL
tara:strand:+ start:4301 stop:4600 length:300 start_codon:yes stop_codon:yes gene_type:complete